MVGVVRIEAVQDQFLAVGLAVLVVVDEQGEVGFLGDVHAFRCELEADGDVEVVCEDGLLIGFAVAVGVLEDDQLIVGQGIAGTVVWVGRGRGDPESTFAVERHLDGLFEVGEFLLRGEELDLVAGGHLHFGDGGLTRQELGRVAVLHVRLEIRRYGRERERLAVVDRQVGPLPLGEAVDEFVAERGELARLRDLGRIVLRAKRVVALAMGVDAVDDRVIAVPEEILHLDRFVDQGLVGAGSTFSPAVEPIGEQLGDGAIAGVGRGEAVDRIGRLGLAVSRERRLEEVNVGQPVLLGHTLHGGGVELKVGVLLFAVGEVALFREVLEGDR